MNKDSQTIYFVDKLGIISLFLDILPYFSKDRWMGIKNKTLYYIDGSKAGISLARFVFNFLNTKVERFDFYMRDVKTLQGDSIWLKVMFGDSLEFQNNLLDDPEFKNAVHTYDKGGGLPLFLLKETMCNHLQDPDVLFRYLFLFRVISWNMQKLNQQDANIIFLIQDKPWSFELRKFAKRERIDVVYLARRDFDLRKMAQRLGIKELLKKIIYYKMLIKHKINGGVSKNSFENVTTSSPKLAVEYYGKLNLDSPELFSDLFFYQMSHFPAKDLLIYFGLPSCPVGDEQLDEIRKRGMSALAINSRAVNTPNVPIFHSSRREKVADFAENPTHRNTPYNRKWLKEKISDYRAQHDYWVEFFTQNNVKIHASWYKQGSNHCAVTDAMRTVGGVNAIYQRSFESQPEPWTTTKSDIVFGFSALSANIGKDRQSMIPYYVVTGYLGDHRFARSQKKAEEVRNSLRKNGAQKIVAYIDENAPDDSRWAMGKEIPHQDQARLFKMVLENPWFGLILKPKFPSGFRTKLGPIAELLRQAEETGRCFVFEQGTLGSNYSPVVAALASDMMIHGYCSAATASVEAALSGKPAIMLDYEGWSGSFLYRLGEGKVIFKNLNDALKACHEHWETPHGIPGFGDWSHILDELDPFRDGRAAERMGTYLQWIQEGFKAKLSKETVLADAAQRYAKAWGKDKILSVNCKDTNLQLV